MQARYYDPVIGRFYSNDPIGFRDVHSFNRYAYANNNPYRYTDPDGQKPGDRFNTPEEAGKDAINTVNPVSIATNTEYGGAINREVSTTTNANGTTSETLQYYATEPVQGNKNSVPIKASKADTVGDYHTHGDYSRELKNGNIVRTSKSRDTFNSDKRSIGKSADSGNTKLLATATKKARAKYGETYKSYLGTPSGKTKIYTQND